MIPDKKKAATIILAKLRSPEKSQEVKPEAELDPKAEGLKAAAEDAMQAIKDGSAHDLMVALRSFYDQCEASEQPE